MKEGGTNLNVRLEITQRDIDWGIPADTSQSAAADALGYWARLQGIGEAHHVNVGDRVVLEVGDRRWETGIEHCGGLGDWVNRLENGESVSPAVFEFTLHENTGSARAETARGRGPAGRTVERTALVELAESREGAKVLRIADRSGIAAPIVVRAKTTSLKKIQLVLNGDRIYQLEGEEGLQFWADLKKAVENIGGEINIDAAAAAALADHAAGRTTPLGAKKYRPGL